MTGDRVAALAVAVPFLLGTAAAAPAGGGEEVFRFEDPAIVESSGLAVADGLFLTTNDSGDTGRVFAVDPETGETVGVTTWSSSPTDVEALAPAGRGSVWVGDIGDNPASRESLSVAKVPVGRGERSVEPEAVELSYPDGPRDAEALLAHPVTGRLYVASKAVFGGALYAVPRRLEAGVVNLMSELAPVMPIVTDGAFAPDGRHLVLRDYGRAVVYTFPGLGAVADVTLPRQQQGEGIAVDAEGRVYVSSEGRRSAVLEIALPGRLRDLLAGRAETAAPPDDAEGADDAGDGEAAPAPGPVGESAPPPATSGDRPVWPWLVVAGAGLGLLVILLRSLRPR